MVLHLHLSSPPGFSGVRVTRSLVLCVCFVDRCLSFVLFLLTILFVFDIRILIKLFLIKSKKWTLIDMIWRKFMLYLLWLKLVEGKHFQTIKCTLVAYIFFDHIRTMEAICPFSFGYCAVCLLKTMFIHNKINKTNDTVQYNTCIDYRCHYCQYRT